MHYHRFGFLADWPRYQQAAFEQTRAIAGEALFARLLDYGPAGIANPLVDRSQFPPFADIAAE